MIGQGDDRPLWEGFGGADEGSSAVVRIGSQLNGAQASPSAPLVPLLDGPAIAAPLPPLEYLVQEIALVSGPGAPHLVAGYGFGGKTLAMQSMALSLAAATPVWGTYRVRDPHRIVHVDMEQGERLSRRRYQRLARAMSVRLEDLGDRLTLAAIPPIQLTSEHTAHWLELMTGRHMILIDSLRAASGGRDENSSDIRGCLDLLGQLSEQTGCRAVVILHARKPTENAEGGRYSIRGSSALYDAGDSIYLLSADKGEPAELEHVKARSHGEPVDSLSLVISDVPDGQDPKWGLRVQVHGKELVEERRDAKADAKRGATAAADAAKLLAHLHKVAPEWPGYRDLRAALGISGDRLLLAVQHLGGKVVRETVRTGKAGSQPVVFKLAHS